MAIEKKELPEKEVGRETHLVLLSDIRLLDKKLEGLDKNLPVILVLNKEKDSSESRGTFLKELGKSGVRIEQLSAERRYPKEMQEQKDIRDEAVFSHDHYFDVGASAKAAAAISKIKADSIKSGWNARAGAIAEKIRSHEWSGNIFVEVEDAPTRFREKLAEALGDEKVKITSSYSPLVSSRKRRETEKIFGKGVARVHRPEDELERLYAYGRAPADLAELEAREKLLGARSLVYNTVILHELENSVHIQFDKIKKIVNELSYEECENVMYRVKHKTATETEPLKLLEEYLRLRNSTKYDARLLLLSGEGLAFAESRNILAGQGRPNLFLG